MKSVKSRSTAATLFGALFVVAAPLFVGCERNENPVPPASTSTTPPGSGTTTTPGSGTTTTPGSGTTTTPGSGTTTTPGSGTAVVKAVADYIKDESTLNLLEAAVARTGLASTLNAGGLTVFAPSDDAFRAAGYANEAAINAAPTETLKQILLYHVIGSRVDISAMPTAVSTEYATKQGRNIYVYKVDRNQVFINNARVSNGDIPATASVIHIIDRLLSTPSQSAIAIAKANPDLSFFAAAVERAGSSLQSAMEQNGVTLFVPNNAAFKAAGYADEAAIRAANAQTLANLLNYHLVKSVNFSPVLLNGTELTTAQGGKIRVNVSNGKITVMGAGNGTTAANITQADMPLPNGVIHLIDRVLQPAQ